MNPVLSRAQIRQFDRVAIELCQVPGVLLMENAGRGVADVICQHGELFGVAVKGQGRALIICGTGNNGGDGFVIARILKTRGWVVQVMIAGQPDQIAGDALVNFKAWVGLGGGFDILDRASIAAVEMAASSADIVIDAIFGTGLARPISGVTAEIIAAINRVNTPKLAVDLPSGIDADTGQVLGVAVRADCTVTFAHRKLGLLTPVGANHAGRVFVADIGVPPSLVEQTGFSAQLVEASDIAFRLPKRNAQSYKHSAGTVLVLAGSSGKTGAAVLASKSALRAGAGLVTLATWPQSAGTIESRLTEVMVSVIDEKQPVDSVESLIKNVKAIVVGPGFGLHQGARNIVEYLLDNWQGPMIIDADAITMFAGNSSRLASSAASLILTPHPGEMASLIGSTKNQVEADRYGAAQAAAKAAKATVLLKGAYSLIANEQGVWVNSAGNAALATAGAGDVLAGIIGALSCHLSPIDSALSGAFIHGLAAQIWTDENKIDSGMLASDIIDLLPKTIASLVALQLLVEGSRPSDW